ncbi:hypothetical protein SETIT_7G140600v2 [Setaria italica]|uniref:Uncharacterized protein n=1 Tax=Setaria italica TaxID=4555 RepID=A0A368RVE3_SETIT|nr:hypothetical protein SETIT_7G140600v2 [Setaria italica]
MRQSKHSTLHHHACVAISSSEDVGGQHSAASATLLLFVRLEEGNRETAVEAGAASAAVEAVAASGPAGPTAERALAALELLCTAPSGAVAVQREALAVPVLARAVEGMSGRGRECGAGERKGGRYGNW